MHKSDAKMSFENVKWRSSSSHDGNYWHTQERYSSRTESGRYRGKPYVLKSYECQRTKHATVRSTVSIPCLGQLERCDRIAHSLDKQLTVACKELDDEYHYEITLKELEEYAHNCQIRPDKQQQQHQKKTNSAKHQQHQKKTNSAKHQQKKTNSEEQQHKEFLLDLAKHVCANRLRFIIFQEVLQALTDRGIAGHDGVRPVSLAVEVIECAVDAGLLTKAYNFDNVTSEHALWVINGRGFCLSGN